MKISCGLPNSVRLAAMSQPWEASVTGADQTRIAKRVDDLGFDMLCIPEHFVIPTQHVPLSGAHYFDATAAQGYLAGATSRITLSSIVTVLPLHHPIVLAKALATLDWLSSGRMNLMVGVGWLKEEFDIMRIPFGERGRMADEYCEAMIELWTNDSPSYDGRYVSFSDVAFEPKPVQRPHIPMWMGGDADAVLKRAARFAVGWNPFLTQPRDFPDRIDFIKSQPAYDGREFDVLYALGTGRIGEGHVANENVELPFGMSAQQMVDGFGELAALGVTMSGVPIPPVRDCDEYLDYCQWLMEEVAPQLA